MKVLVFALALSNLSSTPIWKLYPHLICRYQEAQFCDLSLTNCDAERGAAVVAFDFPNKEVRSVGITHPSKIEGFNFLDLPGKPTGVSAIYTNGTVYSFMKITKSEAKTETDEIEGFVQMPSIDSALTVHTVCHPLE